MRISDWSSDVCSSDLLVGHLTDDIDDRAIARTAAAARVTVTPLSQYYSGAKPKRGLTLGYAAASARQIAGGVEGLRGAQGRPAGSAGECQRVSMLVGAVSLNKKITARNR